MPLLLHVLGKCLIKIPIIWQQSNKNNTPTQKVFKIFANINVNFAGSSQVVEAIPVCLPLPPRLSLSLSRLCAHLYSLSRPRSARLKWQRQRRSTQQQQQQESKKKLQKRRRRRQAGREAGWKAADDTQEAWPIKFQN